MKISKLSARTGLPVGTLKYYLREGLMPSGRRTSRTAAEYDDSHVERALLVRALTDVGGLGIAAVQRVVAVIDAPEPARLDVLATAQDALLGGHSRDLERDQERADGGRADQECADGEGSRAREWAEGHGWRTFPEDLLVGRLDRAWEACEQAGVALDEADLHRYARAMEEVAEVDVEAVPVGAAEAVRRVVVGTVMVEPVLSALRLMAQREVSMGRAGQRPAEGA
ncbi:MerR family transcriptional regulator [Brachybacterium saurashtrense]|uniref:MerR family transcriptional regulator n=1 Tax=Brachybacterium saurashtrense TaxID=556288 RepID=A0A345YQQ3_9MICO|nr:MerR family transcriptional regulator [Brachybacterium saurashtrense]AXK46255.1 MerR family transcriptional regulator [Brachybacterium saurashtrense]RRR23995.1 MerR family transcriptional regulator [Brachybacterium saurashtrense]